MKKTGQSQSDASTIEWALNIAAQHQSGVFAAQMAKKLTDHQRYESKNIFAFIKAILLQDPHAQLIDDSTDTELRLLVEYATGTREMFYTRPHNQLVTSERLTAFNPTSQ